MLDNTYIGRFSIELDDSVIWNKLEFLKFLIKYQGKPIDIEIPEGVCLTSAGVYELIELFEFKRVSIRTNNIVENIPAQYRPEIHPCAWQYFDVGATNDYQQYHAWNNKYIFGTMYNRPTWYRIGIVSHLLSISPDLAMINFRHDPIDPDSRRMFELEKLFQVDPESIKRFSGIVHKLPMRLEEQDGFTVGATTQQHTDQLAQFYSNFFIDIVSETFVRGRTFYPTEKTIRPMLLKKPFILMGPKCFLIHLRQMGFKTFYEFWDEDYDGYVPEIRYLKILELIDTITKKTHLELRDMYNHMQPILDHNYNLLLEKTFTKKIDYVD